MRALFLSTPGIGHVFPMVPLAWAMRAAGHEVRVATTGAALEVARAGLPVVDVAPDLDFRALQAQVIRDNPDLVQAMRTGGTDDLRRLAVVAGQVCGHLAEGVIGAAQCWQSDIIVQSPMLGAGLLAGAKLDVPVVDHGFGFLRTAELSTLAVRHMPGPGPGELPRPHAIDVAPPSMLDEPEGWPMRYVPFNGGAVLPSWLETRQRNRIAVTLGTTAPGREGIDPLRRLIDAARHADAEFVLAVADSDASDLGPLPPNVTAGGWIPLNALLPTCDAIAHHGGAGTTLTALAHGVPQLVVPTGSDRFINAEAVRHRGTGFVAEPEEITTELLMSVGRDAAIRAAAVEVRKEISDMPTPAEIVQRLVEVAS